jgi:dual oxidase
MHQQVSLYEWLPLFVSNTTADYAKLDPMTGYTGYRDTVNPQVSHVFQSAAMRIGHTFVTPGVYRRTEACEFNHTANPNEFNTIRTCNSYFRPAEIFDEYTSSFKDLVLGMVSQLTEKEDHIITEDLRGFVFGPLEALRRDLMAINIQRSRDHGLPSYNNARVFFGLEAHAEFENITTNAAVAANMRDVYEGKMENLDIWTGGLAETEDFIGPGELFSAIITEQYIRIRDGDRYWFENEHNNLFTEEEVALIKDTNFGDILARTLDIPRSHFRTDKSVFFAADESVDATGTIVGGMCKQPKQLSTADLEDCTPAATYDYFYSSYDSGDIPFTIGLGLGGCIFLAVGLMIFFVRRGRKQRELLRHTAQKIQRQQANSASGLSGQNESLREDLSQAIMDDPDVPEEMRHLFKARLRSHGFISNATLDVVYVQIVRETSSRAVVVYTPEGAVIQSVPVDDIRAFHTGPLFRSIYLSCRSNPGTSLLFNPLLGAKFTVRLEQAVRDTDDPLVGVSHASDDDVIQAAASESLEAINRINAATEYGITQVFKDSGTGITTQDKFDAESVRTHNTVLKNLRLSSEEFAGLIGMPPEHEFVISLFNFADFNDDGFLSGDELLGVLKPFSEPDKAKRTKMLFNVYDNDKSNTLDRDELHEFIISLYALTGLSDLTDERADAIVNNMFAGVSNIQAGVTCDEFVEALLKQDQLQEALDRLLPGHHSDKANNDLAPSETDDNVTPSSSKGTIRQWSDYIAANRLDCFWFMAFVVVTALIFYERFWNYQVITLHGGLKRITGNGVATTRGGASAMMWAYAVAILPLCRNTLTWLRGTFVSKLINLDSAIEFHKLAAFVGFVFMGVHLIGHTINFYNLSTQPAGDAACLFRQVFWTSNFLPSFGWWVFETVTGLSGFLLTAVAIFMYAFSLHVVRQSSFVVFWTFHQLWVAFFFFLYLHGAARLVQAPFFYYFSLGPLLLFVIDKMITFSRSHHDLRVYEAIMLPSGVYALKMEKPPGFENMQSGQWLRLKCASVSTNEWHPFTISSAPQQNYVSVHIRTAGPWTTKCRAVFAEALTTGGDLPCVQIEGPFGETHQDWLSAQAAIFVGGGIGVTPFASILEDLAWRYRNNQAVSLDRIHFIWVTRTQKEYEWMVELLRDVQEDIPEEVLDVSIYITRGKQNYDLRTSLMYMFERNHVEGSNESLLTGLRATTNFQRPNFSKLLPILRDRYAPRQVSIYTCGPGPLAANVESGTRLTNEQHQTQVPLIHHYVSF